MDAVVVHAERERVDDAPLVGDEKLPAGVPVDDRMDGAAAGRRPVRACAEPFVGQSHGLRAGPVPVEPVGGIRPGPRRRERPR